MKSLNSVTASLLTASICSFLACSENYSKGATTETTNAISVIILDPSGNPISARYMLRPANWVEGLSSTAETQIGILQIDSFTDDNGRIDVGNIAHDSFFLYVESDDSSVALEKFSLDSLDTLSRTIRLGLGVRCGLNVAELNSGSTVHGVGFAFYAKIDEGGSTLWLPYLPKGAYAILQMTPDSVWQATSIWIGDTSQILQPRWDTILDPVDAAILGSPAMTFRWDSVASNPNTSVIYVPIRIDTSMSLVSFFNVQGAALPFEQSRMNFAWVRFPLTASETQFAITQVGGSSANLGDGVGAFPPTDTIAAIFHLDGNLSDASGQVPLRTELPWIQAAYVADSTTQSIEFRLPGDSIHVPLDLTADTILSISCWFYPTGREYMSSLISGSQQEFRMGWGGGDAGGSPKIRFDVYFTKPDSSDTVIVIQTPEIDTNQWHHIVSQVDMVTRTMSLYVDGQLYSTLGIGNLTGKIFDLPGVRFGGQYASFTDQFQGRLDEVRVFRKARSLEEIQQEWWLGREMR